MRPNFTLNLIVLFFTTCVSLSVHSQNLLSNPSFNQGSDAWLLTGMQAEINTEDFFGGRIRGNKVAEIDAASGLRQKFVGAPGKIYTLSYKAARRTNGVAPASVGVTVRVIGNSSGTVFFSYNTTYSNAIFSYTSEIRSFSVPAISNETVFIVELVAYDNNTTHGVIVDDIEMMMGSAASVPVMWKTFTAEIRNQQAVLNWKTADEIHNKQFMVEKSTNGTSYEVIGTVWTNAARTYTFTDTRLLNGTSFYRLRQVDLDGNSSISKVVVVKVNADNKDLKLFPTIASNTVNFNLNSINKTDVRVSVFDASGRVMIQSQRSLTNGVNQQSVDISTLNKGTYYFSIRNDDGSIQYSKAFQKAE